jgi:hypothetical protein
MDHEPRVYVDFMKTDARGRLLLVCIGTRNDLRKHGIALAEGMRLRVYSDDANDQGERDDLLAEGVVHYNAEAKEWVLAVEPTSIRHEPERNRGSD